MTGRTVITSYSIHYTKLYENRKLETGNPPSLITHHGVQGPSSFRLHPSSFIIGPRHQTSYARDRNMNDTTTQTSESNLRVAGRRDRSHIPSRFKNILCLDDFEEPARRFLPRPIFGYVSGGVETNSARDGNRAAFAERNNFV